MKTQNYSNHRQLVPSYHFFTFLILIALMVLTGIYFFSDDHDKVLLPYILVLLILSILSVGLHARMFALKAQDRAIRAEENLRYFILTGKRLNTHLSIHQIIALRFASDEELVVLAERANNENLSPKEIKMAIKTWRADFHRV